MLSRGGVSGECSPPRHPKERLYLEVCEQEHLAFGVRFLLPPTKATVEEGVRLGVCDFRSGALSLRPSEVFHRGVEGLGGGLPRDNGGEASSDVAQLVRRVKASQGLLVQAART